MDATESLRPVEAVCGACSAYNLCTIVTGDGLLSTNDNWLWLWGSTVEF